MKGIFIRATTLLLSAVLIISYFSIPAYADDLNSYYYNDLEKSQVSPAGYMALNYIDTLPDGTKLTNLVDMYIDTDGILYLLDSKNNCVITFDKNMNYQGKILFSENDKPITFSNAKGMYIREKVNDKTIYIADSDNHRIIKADINGKVISMFLKPDSDIFSKEEDFFPEKVLVSDSDTVFVLCRGIYKGAVVFDDDGDFLGYYGSNKVKVTAKVLYDYAWKKVFGSKMTAASTTYVPIEFTNFDIDENGFVYTITSSDSTDAVINRMNFKSGNLFSSSSKFGDFENLDSTGKEIATEFIDIAYMQYGIFAALDRTRGRVFLYDKNGDNLMNFGNLGSKTGTFSQPAAIETFKDKIYIYDNTLGSVSVFSPSEYGKNVLKATRMYLDGNYDDSIETWNKVLEENQSFSLAYLSIGRSLSGQNRNREAMQYFKSANAKADYSEVFKEVRKEFLVKWLWLITTIIIFLVMALISFSMIKRKSFNHTEFEKGPSVFSALSHPKRDMVLLVRKNTKTINISIVILAIWFIVEVIAVNATGFIFSTARENPLNLGITLASTAGLVLIFVAVNWLIAAVFNGNGSFVEIFSVTMIALVPYIISRVIRTIMSNFCSLDESAFMGFVIAIGLLWALFVLLVGLSQIHEFGVAGTVGGFLFTLVGMLLILFLMLLVGSVIAQMFQLVQTIWGELLCLIE